MPNSTTLWITLGLSLSQKSGLIIFLLAVLQGPTRYKVTCLRPIIGPHGHIKVCILTNSLPCLIFEVKKNIFGYKNNFQFLICKCLLTGEYFTKTCNLYHVSSANFLPTKFWGNFDKTSILMQNYIVEDMVKRNWRNI